MNDLQAADYLRVTAIAVLTLAEFIGAFGTAAVVVLSIVAVLA
jgi:hypothetical protein